MDYVIEKNVPMPVSRQGKKRWPFDNMEVGDSFGFEPENQKKVAGAASAHGRAYGKKFSVQQTESGPRCWRTE